jgi:hypothetical protein
MDPEPQPSRPLLIEANVIAYFGDLIIIMRDLAKSGHKAQ